MEMIFKEIKIKYEGLFNCFYVRLRVVEIIWGLRLKYYIGVFRDV